MKVFEAREKISGAGRIDPPRGFLRVMTTTQPTTKGETMKVKVTNKDFGYTVKFLKKYGYTFDSATKTWTGSRDVSFLTEEGYAVEEEKEPRGKEIEDTRTFSELVRIGAATKVNGTLNQNVGANMFTPSFADGRIELWDGQVCCWGSDDEIADLLSALPTADDADFDDVWSALAELKNNA